MKFGTKAIHAGVKADPTTGAIMTPIYQTSTFVQDAPGKHKGYEYARTKNPTRTALEDNLTALENGNYGACFSSGMAAEDAVSRLLKPGDEIIATNDLYGGSYRFFVKVLQEWGVKTHFISMENVENIRSYINENTKMLWVETPTNPTLNIIDIAAAASIAKEHGILLTVDNTFASPYLQNPLNLGADIVTHSTTKYIGGHSDVVGGAVICNDKEIADKIYFIQNTVGAVPGPQDSFLTLRGIKTLHLRMKQHCENARKVAHFLNDHEKVDIVNYPGLERFPNHDIAKKQMNDFGGMLSFTLKGDKMDDANKMLQKTKVFSLAESLGGVESLIGHPATMTHAAIPKEEREKSGVKDSLIRLSVGIEDQEDLITDLDQALRSL